MVTVYRASGRVDRYLVVVHAKAVPLGVAVGKEPSLEHLVGGEADPRHHAGGVEGRLLHVPEVVVGVPVQFELAYLYQRIVLFIPHLGKVEGVVRHAVRLLLGHHLDEQGPPGEVPPLDGVVQVPLVAFPAFADDLLRLLVSQVFYALLRMEVELHPDPFVCLIDHAVGMASEAVHVAVGQGYAPVAHGDGHLV